MSKAEGIAGCTSAGAVKEKMRVIEAGTTTFLSISPKGETALAAFEYRMGMAEATVMNIKELLNLAMKNAAAQRAIPNVRHRLQVTLSQMTNAERIGFGNREMALAMHDTIRQLGG